jgi:RNA polymerase sigma-70 factor (ECF subfamily)
MSVPDASVADELAPVALEIGSLFRAHAETVHRWAVRLGGPDVDADDVVQEVFLVAQRRLHEFRGDAKIETWLYRITDRMVRKQKVSPWRRRLRSLLIGRDDEVATVRQGGPPTPLDALERRDATHLVYAALADLPEKQRRAVILYELDGMSGEEIAELTGTKLSTVWVHLHRGRERFRARLRALRGQGDKA